MIKPLKRYKLKLNSIEKIEELLQELYNESCKNIEDVQTQMNKVQNSVLLQDEIMDAKAKYAKAMNDFITNKDKAIGRKLEIAKLMSEIMKYNGDVKKAFSESETVGDWGDLVAQMEKQQSTSDTTTVQEYKLK